MKRNWKQIWDAVAVLTDLASKSPEYQASMLITCVGSEALPVVNALPYATSGDRMLRKSWIFWRSIVQEGKIPHMSILSSTIVHSWQGKARTNS